MIKNISVSKAKAFHACPLSFNYKYINKFEMVNPVKDPATTKGLILHEVFEKTLIYENYENGTPLPIDQLSKRKIANEQVVLDIFKKAMETYKFSVEDAVKYNLKLGIKRWLSFKHDYLDKKNHVFFAEKRYNEALFDGVKTVTILDLLEDNGDGTFTIYDYKTPVSINISNYKAQLITYAYQIACVKGIIKPGDTDYNKIVKNFKLYIFFPLCTGDHEDYEPCLKLCKFDEEDVKKTIEDLKQTCTDIDTFDFNKSAECLQPPKMDNFNCRFCDYLGAAPQPDIKFEGCPISYFAGYKQKSLFKKV